MRDLLQDFGTTEVRDEPRNRARRAAFLSSLPRVYVPVKRQRFAWLGRLGTELMAIAALVLR